MYRKLVCSMVVMMAGIGFVAADEFTCVITKVNGTKVTFYKTKKVDKKMEKDGDAMTLTVGDKATIAKGKGAKGGKVEVGDTIETGLKDDIFTKIDEKKGVNARITTEGEGDKTKITQILVIMGKKKKDVE